MGLHGISAVVTDEPSAWPSDLKVSWRIPLPKTIRSIRSDAVVLEASAILKCFRTASTAIVSISRATTRATEPALIGEGTIGEGNSALVFCDFRVAPLGDNAALVEVGHQPAE